MNKTLIDTDQGCSEGRRIRVNLSSMTERLALLELRQEYYSQLGFDIFQKEAQSTEKSIRQARDVASAALSLCEVCHGNPMNVSIEDRSAACPAAAKVIDAFMKVND